jgi:hypothetical protein
VARDLRAVAATTHEEHPMQTTNTPIEVGTTVFGSDGEKIGEVAEVQRDYFLIEKGFIFTKDIYIPMTSVAGPAEDGDGVMVDLSKDAIEHGDWSQPPVLPDQADAGPVGYAGQHTSTETLTGTTSTTGFGEAGVDDRTVVDDRSAFGTTEDDTIRPER